MTSYPKSCFVRSISTTPTRSLGVGWFEKIKRTFTGKKTLQETAAEETVKQQSFSLNDFANQMDTARKMGSMKNFMVGRCSEATISDAFEKQAVILRYLGGIDPTGENIRSNHKQDAAMHCNCTLADVENALSKYTWAIQAQKKIEKLAEEGKPTPKTFSEVQKLMGSTPLEVARNNLQKSGRVNKNALCPCGSNKKYKRCCGTAESW